jgi:hypothetical protein
MRKPFLALAALLVVTAIGASAPKAEAARCPIYQHCMVFYPEGTCACEGFYCNGQFICGIPVN